MFSELSACGSSLFAYLLVNFGISSWMVDGFRSRWTTTFLSVCRDDCTNGGIFDNVFDAGIADLIPTIVRRKFKSGRTSKYGSQTYKGRLSD